MAGGLALAWWRGWLKRRAWLVGLALQAILVASGFAALQTGETEEDRVEAVVPDAALDHHEEAAEVFFYGSIVVLGLFAGAAVIRPRKLALGTAAAATVGAIVVLGLGVQVGQAGGELVYKHGAASAYVGQSAAGIDQGAPQSRAYDDDDD